MVARLAVAIGLVAVAMFVASTLDGHLWWPKVLGGAVIALLCLVATLFERGA